MLCGGDTDVSALRATVLQSEIYMKKLYFIIPVYKVENYLERCVESVLAQSYNNVEIVLIDDGSPDRCPEMCDKYAEMHDNVHVIHKPNGGLSDARNAGLDYIYKSITIDDYITFLDSDDFVHPLYAEKMVSLCEDNGCNMAQCAYEKGSADVFSETGGKPNITVTDSESALLGYTLKSQFAPKIFKAYIFSELRFTKGVLNEDEFSIYKAAFAAKTVAFTDEKLYYYFQRDESIMVEIAKKLKNNPHRYDFITAYNERIAFFTEKNLPLQVMKSHEKICTDIILRYCEQMYVEKQYRDEDCINGEYMRIYREHYKLMIKRKMPLKRKLMYIAFNILPYSAVIMGKIFTLRK